jgi:hypothetical protein
MEVLRFLPLPSWALAPLGVVLTLVVLVRLLRLLVRELRALSRELRR